MLLLLLLPFDAALIDIPAYTKPPELFYKIVINLTSLTDSFHF